jgi:hypothetical protein
MFKYKNDIVYWFIADDFVFCVTIFIGLLSDQREEIKRVFRDFPFKFELFAFASKQIEFYYAAWK